MSRKGLGMTAVVEDGRLAAPPTATGAHSTMPVTYTARRCATS